MKWMTWIIVVTCAIIYMSPDYSQLMSLGAMDPSRVWSGEIWRLVTPLFLHGNLLHLILNCIVLLQIGGLVEPVIGPSRFLLTFLITGMVSFCCSLLFNEGIAIGSSGAVFGLVGLLMSMLALSPKQIGHRLFLRSLVWFVLINLAFGFGMNWGFSSSTTIDNVAHISGWTMGLLLGVAFFTDTPWFKHSESTAQTRRQVFSHIALAASFAIWMGLLLIAIQPTFKVNYQYWLAERAISETNLNDAAHIADKIQTMKDGKGLYALIQAQIHHSTTMYEKAFPLVHDEQPRIWQQIWANSTITMCDAATHLKSDIITYVIWNDCAWMLLTGKDQDPKRALLWAQEALKLSKGTVPEILDTLSKAYEKNGNLEEARALSQRASLMFNQKNRRTKSN